MTAVIIQVYESRGMDVDGLIQSCQTREDWGPTSTYIKPLSPLDPLVELYCTLVKFVAFDYNNEAGHRARKYISRLYGENSSEFTNLLNTPPILVMTSVPSREDGCHYRIVSACDVIFIDYSVIARWRSTLMDPGSIQCRSQLQLIKSLVVHELAHRIITYRMGWALPHDLVTFNKDTTLLPEQDKQSFLRMRNKLANDQTTPPKFHLPWRSSRKAEAGEWLEFKIFGGVVRVDGAGQATATLQHSRDTVSPLSPNMLDHCGTSVLINYVEEYPELAEMNHIILSPSSNQNHRKTVSGGKAQQRLCAGVKRVSLTRIQYSTGSSIEPPRD
ncbi:hypothetical protein B0H17DRAFT_1136345 [Mycena rosella]|uniref:Uncharacterized protein n=1 Tax=Mycena rosella TaxID=1033263 RepID=A0AAD7DB57_MYCRO|nr:hypothetical protein B0H17DRAFT_1136345 [Mycena rosella]